jgi:hypothetical protein
MEISVVTFIESLFLDGEDEQTASEGVKRPFAVHKPFRASQLPEERPD